MKKRLSFPSTVAVVLMMLAAQSVFAGGSRAITLIAPNNGATLSTGQKMYVHWSYAGYPDNAKVEIILWQNGSKKGNIALSAPIHLPEFSAGDGGFWWIVGQQDNGTAVAGCVYTVSVKVNGYSGDGSLQSKPFCITSPGQQASITVLSPNGGEKLLPGNKHTIRWNSSGVSGNVKIRLRKAGLTGDRTIADNLPVSDGVFVWTVGKMLPPSSDLTESQGGLKIVVETMNGQFSDESNAAFSLAKPIIPNLTDPQATQPWIRISSPKNGDVVQRGKPFFIRWTFSGSLQGKKAKIQLLKPDGSFYQEIEAECPLSIDDYRWNVPGKDFIAAGNYKMRMQAVDYPSVMDDSKIFSLAADEGEIVSAPADGLSVKPGQEYKIKWKKDFFPSAKVKIELYTADKNTRLGDIVPVLEAQQPANDGECDTYVYFNAGYQENKRYRVKVSTPQGGKSAWSGEFLITPLQKVEMKGTFGTPSFNWFHVPRGEHASNRRFNPYLAGKKSDGEGNFFFRTYLLPNEQFLNWDIAKAEVKLKFSGAHYSSGVKRIGFYRRDDNGFEQNSPHFFIADIEIPDDPSQVVTIDVTGLLREVATGARFFYGFVFRGGDHVEEETWDMYCSISDLKLEVTYYVKK